MSGLSGLLLDAGRSALKCTSCEAWWFVRSMFLCNGCTAAEPRLAFARATDPVTQPARARDGTVVFGFRLDASMRAWARAHSAAIAMPAAEITATIGDKTRLPGLAASARVAVPRSVVRHAAGAEDAAVLWRELGAERAVVQRAENDLTGVGTSLVDGPESLAQCLDRWGRRDVKLAEYVEGLPATVSAVATARGVVVSGISQQLVGYPELTPVWGAHCGNQLLDDAQLPPGAAGAVRKAATRLGTLLRDSGFHGMFGLDLIITASDVIVLEINPRVQSVSSLLNGAELAVGLLPAPLLHLLDFVDDRAADGAVSSAEPVPPFGQLVVGASASGWVVATPEPGVHRLVSERGSTVAVADPAPLGDLAPDQALVWPFAAPGDRISPADRLFVVQTSTPVASYPGGSLTPAARAWLAALLPQALIEGTTHDSTE